MPLDERTEQVDLVGGGHLVGDLVTDARLVPAVDQQRAGGEWGGGAWWKCRCGWGNRRCGDGVQDVLGVDDLVLAREREGIGIGYSFSDPICQLNLAD
ncbi:hypothetical protein [Micromonospora qiuiae]|uniref:hypothetical protein n=1 Tax=Micromonospora qiuiae TaxID=502268 RepID=UPI003557A98B